MRGWKREITSFYLIQFWILDVIPWFEFSHSDKSWLDNRDTKESIVDLVCALKQKAPIFQTFTLLFLKQLNFLLTLLLTRMPRQKTEELESLSKSEKIRLNRVYSSSRAAYGSIQNLSKASGLSKERRKFLQTKISYTKFGPIITRFRRLQAFSKYINEIWCLNLAFLDKLASQNNGVKYLLFAVDIISRFFRVQTRKTEYAKDTSQAFRKTISRKNTPEKL